ncbi:MAG TPA: MlaD family protein [Solirubrobacterales bacterium]|nr:MlaD family protein [Solirubrobacterales bacterium]
MSKRAPSTMQLLAITGFALACFGILLFLWITFGGPTPFKAKSYQIKIPFTEASQLAEQSDVRISGVDVGKVESIELGPKGEEAMALLTIDDKYAPLRHSTRAMLRTKTLLGETYVELTPGAKGEPALPDDATLPTAQVTESVQLDEIFQAFDPETRHAFQTWMQEASVAIAGQGQNLSYAIGNFDPTFSEFENLFRVLNSQKLAVSQLFSNGAKTFEALRGREGELADLIQSSNDLFKTTAARDQDIEALFRAFPTYLDESRLTVARLRNFATDADPLSKQLVPVAEQLSPTLVAFGKLAPEAKKLFEALPAAEKEAPTGFPALRKLFRDEFPPLLRAAEPFVRNFNPFITGLGLYKREIAATVGNLAATFHAKLTGGGGSPINYLRVMGPINAETLSTYPTRLTNNRNSPYSPPRWAGLLANGSLPAYDTRQCTGGASVTVAPTPNNDSALLERIPTERFKYNPSAPNEEEVVTLTAEQREKEAEELLNNLKAFAFGGQSGTAGAPAPPCNQQGTFESIYGSGEKTQYQHTYEQTGR